MLSNKIMKLYLTAIFLILMSSLSFAGTSGIKWTPTPESAKFQFPGNELKNNWDNLQALLQQPWPSAKNVKETVSKPGATNMVKNYKGDYNKYASDIQQVWRYFFEGNYKAARDLGFKLGTPGYVPAAYAQMFYAAFFEEDKGNREELYNEIREKSLNIIKTDHYNINVRLFAAYSQLRMMEQMGNWAVLKSGYLPSSLKLIYEILALDPDNQFAQLMVAAVNGNVVGRAGEKFATGLFDMNKENVDTIFKRAINSQTRPVPELYYEYGMALLATKDDKLEKRAIALIKKAAELTPSYSMEVMSIKAAKESYADETKGGWF